MRDRIQAALRDEHPTMIVQVERWHRHGSGLVVLYSTINLANPDVLVDRVAYLTGKGGLAWTRDCP